MAECLTCGICYYFQVDHVRIELNSETPCWCLTIGGYWWGNLLPATLELGMLALKNAFLRRSVGRDENQSSLFPMQCSFDCLNWYPVALIQSSSLFLLGIRGQRESREGGKEEEGEGREGKEERGKAKDRIKDRTIDKEIHKERPSA